MKSAQDSHELAGAPSLPQAGADSELVEPVAYLSKRALKNFDVNGTEIFDAMLFPKGTLSPELSIAVYPASSLSQLHTRLATVERERDEVQQKHLGAERVCDTLDNQRRDAVAKLAEAREVIEPFAASSRGLEITIEQLERARSFLSSIAEKTTPATDREGR